MNDHPPTPKTDLEQLRRQAQELRLYGLLSDWEAVCHEPWLESFLLRELAERQQRSLERRLTTSKIGRFKPIADFDYTWPQKIDREQIEDLFRLQWLDEALNVILVGPNGVGKTMIAQNLAYQAIHRGATARLLTASQLLNDLAAQEGARALQNRLRCYYRPALLVIDELGYLSYDHRHADLLFELVSRRYDHKSILITTNKPFAEWNEVFPNATCVVTLVDRLVHHAEIVKIDGESYRFKEAKEQAAHRAQRRAARIEAGNTTKETR
jgi:DNA replication protein DnaC